MLPLIVQLQNVEAAKKQTPCIPLKCLVRMAEELPKDIGTLLDKKNAKGLRKIGVISKEEEKGLNGQNLKRIVHIYVRKVLPQWRLKRSEGMCPREIDDMWAKAGNG